MLPASIDSIGWPCTEYDTQEADDFGRHTATGGDEWQGLADQSLDCKAESSFTITSKSCNSTALSVLCLAEGLVHELEVFQSSNVASLFRVAFPLCAVQSCYIYLVTERILSLLFVFWLEIVEEG